MTPIMVRSFSDHDVMAKLQCHFSYHGQYFVKLQCLVKFVVLNTHCVLRNIGCSAHCTGRFVCTTIKHECRSYMPFCTPQDAPSTVLNASCVTTTRRECRSYGKSCIPFVELDVSCAAAIKHECQLTLGCASHIGRSAHCTGRFMCYHYQT